MLKVVIGNGDTDHRFELRWSNHAEINDNEPGKFKIVRVDLGKPHILYVTDLLSGRKMMNPKTGKPVIDFVAMAVMYGTTRKSMDHGTLVRRKPLNKAMNCSGSLNTFVPRSTS